MHESPLFRTSARRVLALAVFLSVALAGPPPAVAAPAAKADDPDTVKAREFIKKANIHYKVGEYEAAIAAYKEAFKLRPVPALLFNIAQGYRLLGDWKQAKFFYEGAVRDGPDAPYADEARQRIDEMIEKLATTPPPATVAAPAKPPAAVAPAAPAPPVVAPPAVPPAALPPVVADKPARESRPDVEEEHVDTEDEGPGVLPIGLGAGAGALAVASIVCFVLANGTLGQVTAQERPRAQVDAMLRAAEAQWTGGWVTAVGAVGAGVGAGVLFAF